MNFFGNLRMGNGKPVGFARAFYSNRVALVTGGSGVIGRAIAIRLAREGCKVVVNYSKSQTVAEDVCRQIKDSGGLAMAIQCDVGDLGAVKDMFKKVECEFGGVNILVNNAGIKRDMLMVSMKSNDFSDVMNTNVNGVFNCSQVAFKTQMMSKRAGRIINIASIVGQIGNPGQVNYAAAKAAIIGMTKAMAKEFSSRNVCVNAVCPGFIVSDMTEQVNTEEVLSKIPLRRFGTPEEVAGVVRFLALDPAAAYMTGHCVNIDGGIAIGAT